uniref:Uncharacterized protein n=1 Tax=Anopheles coluzzii TaxID=1518534 RepID=A0A8W7PYQ8_ANOCL
MGFLKSRYSKTRQPKDSGLQERKKFWKQVNPGDLWDASVAGREPWAPVLLRSWSGLSLLLLLGLLLHTVRTGRLGLTSETVVLGLGCRRRDLDHDVGRLAADLGLKSFLRVGGVRDGADESVRVNHGVAALDHVSVALLLAVLLVNSSSFTSKPNWYEGLAWIV